MGKHHHDHHHDSNYIPPASTEQVTVIPWTHVGFQENLNFHQLTMGKANDSEIHNILHHLHTIIKHSEESTCWDCFVVLLVLFLFVFTIALMVSSNLLGLKPSIIYTIYAVSVVAIILLSKLNDYQAYWRRKKLREECEKTVEREYHFCRERGLRWYFPAHFPKWIELWNDFLGDGSDSSKFTYPVSSPLVPQFMGGMVPTMTPSFAGYPPQNVTPGYQGGFVSYQPQNVPTGSYQSQNAPTGSYQPQNVSAGTQEGQYTQL